MTQRLTGKTALVTAAGQGIGRATALAMAAEGAKVLATDINVETLAALRADAAGDLEVTRLDVRDDAQVAEIVGEANPDILFNCAGFVHHGTILDATDEEWDFAFDLNVRSMFRTMRAALPGMLARGNGSIINMSSAASSIIGAPNRFVYGATKAAVIGMTKAVAKDYITQGVRCNAICPGTVESPSLHDRLRATGDYEAAMKAFVARQPMGRIGKAEEIAALAVYLGSDESAFTTGQAHIIDGGWAG
ncbi:SDR family oxidoreductase [Ruegeria marina]|uniref:2-keto-3-deoxy-L-fuconate dehydrogenase n=1 Tax=Ruegeria marina TaxID=639004 RepID=A0A1G6XAM0_9RHOB|nr:SDR family oxidoreductase [Ruegeria marina]SDD74863.1 2-keto-3-deoxy-L-fuconate dehydrogenase [Ruegeria marina]